MSCRVVGLDVEQQMLRTVIDSIRGNEVIADFVKTERNHLCTDLYAKNGFLRSEDGHWGLPKPRKQGLLRKILGTSPEKSEA